MSGAGVSGRVNPAYQGVAPWLQDEGQHRRDIARTTNQLLIGKLNVCLDVTLPTSVSTYTVNDARIGITTAIIPQPLTANAATLIKGGYWVDTYLKGSAVMHFAAPVVAADLKIRLVLIG
jgi:hypothetical protein